MNAARQLGAALESEVFAALSDALERHGRRLGLSDVDVAVRILPWGLPETGVHGYAPTAHYAELTLDPGNPQFALRWRSEVPATLAHELHHCRRWRGPGYGSTLLEALVSEGLAQHHEKQERGGQPAPYSHIPGDLAPLWERAKAVLDTPGYDHPAWFFGSAGQGLPRWAGYALGYDLVERFLEAQGGDAADYVDTPAGALRALVP